MSAVIRKLPPFWFYESVIQRDPLALELFTSQQNLRDIHKGCVEIPADEVERRVTGATLLFIEDLLRYASIAIPDELSLDPETRLQQMAECLPIRPIRWSSGAPEKHLVRWAKGQALMETAPGLDRPVPRVELPGSRVVYHRAHDGSPITPVVDTPPAVVRSRLLSGVRKWMIEALDYQDEEAETARRAKFTATNGYEDVSFKPFSRRHRNVDEDGATAGAGAYVARAVPSPVGAAPLPSTRERIRQSTQVLELLTIATPAQREYIAASLGQPARPSRPLNDLSTDRRRERNTKWLADHPTDENRWAVKADRAWKLREGHAWLEMSVDEQARALRSVWVGPRRQWSYPKDAPRHRQRALEIRERALIFPWASTIVARTERWWVRSSWVDPKTHPGCKTCGGSGWLRGQWSRIEQALAYRAQRSTAITRLVGTFELGIGRWIDAEMRRLPTSLTRFVSRPELWAADSKADSKGRVEALRDYRIPCPGDGHPQRRRDRRTNLVLLTPPCI